MVTWGDDQIRLFYKNKASNQFDNNIVVKLPPMIGGKRHKKTRSRKQTCRKQTRRIKR